MVCNYSDRMLEQIWTELEDVAFIQDEDNMTVLDEVWEGFPVGTAREEIWAWFDEHHSKGIAYIMYGK